MMRKYKTDIVHIFICTNQKIKGKCCAQGNSLEIFDYFKEQLNHKINYLNPQIRFKVVKTSCLGKCGYGPNIVIQPDNIWYNFSSIRDIDDIIEEHLIQGKIITRLLNKGIQSYELK